MATDADPLRGACAAVRICSRTGLLLGLVLGAWLLSPAQADSDLPLGQKLRFRIYWGIIPVANTWVSVEPVERDGRTLVAIRARTRSNAVVEKIYPVDDFIESLVDPQSLLPVRFVKKLSEGRYRCHEVTLFDHARGRAHWKSLLSGREKQYPIGRDTRDLLSFMFSLRRAHFEPGRKYHYQVMADEKIYDLWLTVKGREDTVLLDGTTVRSLVLEPEAAFEGLFVRKGRVWLWVKELPPLVVTRMVARVPVASIKMVLESLPADSR